MATTTDPAREVLARQIVEEVLDYALEIARENELLEENIAAMEDFLKRTILGEDSDVYLPPSPVSPPSPPPAPPSSS